MMYMSRFIIYWPWQFMRRYVQRWNCISYIFWMIHPLTMSSIQRLYRKKWENISQIYIIIIEYTHIYTHTYTYIHTLYNVVLCHINYDLESKCVCVFCACASVLCTIYCVRYTSWNCTVYMNIYDSEYNVSLNEYY